jgi:hypothetical protein
MTGRRRAPPAAQHAHAHAHADAHAGTHSAHARIRTHTHARTAAYAPTHAHMYPAVHVWRARSRPARPRVGASAGPCERGGGGTHSRLRFGQSTAAGSAASSVSPAHLRAHRAAAPGGSGPPRTARRSAARASHARVGLGREPTTGNAAAAASNAARRRPQRPARQRHAHRRHRRERARRRRARTHRVSKRLHWPSDSGSAFTFVRSMYLPEHRARVRPAPAAHQWRDVGSKGLAHARPRTLGCIPRATAYMCTCAHAYML